MEDKISRYIIDRKNDIKFINVKPRLIKIMPTKDFVLCIVGPRRSGKTYFIYQFIKNNHIKDEDYLFINFEEIEESLDDFISKFQEVYGKLPVHLFLDEIQSLNNWEKEIYRIFEKKRFHIFLTGSSSKFLSKEIASQLRGRSVTIKVYPFSFKEVLQINELNKKFYSSEETGKIKNLLKQCLTEGCFPDVVLKKIETSRFFSEYIDLVIYRDIMDRYDIKNRTAMEFFIKNAISSNSNIFSINKIYNTIKSLQIRVSKNTLYNFQKYLEDVNVVFFLKKYSKSVRKIEMSLPKAYVIDNGLYSFITYKRDYGIQMESFVFQELIKSGYVPNKSIYHFGNGFEVDFVLADKEKINRLIQVTYANSKDEIEKREIKSLIKASDLLKCKDLLCITWDYEDEMKIENRKIKFVPLWKWVLEF